MGAWGAGSFENDAALDWLWELESDLDGTILRRAFARVYDGGGDDGHACEAVAAAEVVAASLGRPTPDPMPDEVTEWIERADAFVDDDLRIQALAAVQFVRDRSGLRALWLEADGSEWLVAMDDLATRLEAP